MKYALALLLLAGLVAAEDKRLDYEAKDVALGEVVKRLNAFYGFTLELGDVSAAKRITIKLERATGPQALRKLEDVTGVKLTRVAAGHYRLGDDRAAAIRKAMNSKKVSFSIRGRPISEIAPLLNQSSNVGFTVDRPAMGRKIDITMNDVTLQQALDLMTEPNGLAYDVRCGIVCIATPDRLPRFPAKPPFTLKKAGKSFGITLNGITLHAALKTLSAGSGLKVRLDETIPPKFRDRPVTLHATKTTLADALAILVVPMGLTVVETDEGLVVKPPAK